MILCDTKRLGLSSFVANRLRLFCILYNTRITILDHLYFGP